MFEVFLIASITTFFASFTNKVKTPKTEPIEKSRWELTDEAKAEKRYRERLRETRGFVFLIPVVLSFTPIVIGGIMATGRCAFESVCTHQEQVEAIEYASDQYLPTLLNPIQATEGLPSHLSFLLWLGVIFTYLQILTWIIAVRTLVSLWVHSTHRLTEG